MSGIYAYSFIFFLNRSAYAYFKEKVGNEITSRFVCWDTALRCDIGGVSQWLRCWSSEHKDAINPGRCGCLCDGGNKRKYLCFDTCARVKNLVLVLIWSTPLWCA